VEANNAVLLLTATVSVGTTPNVERADPVARLNDYIRSLDKWLEQREFKKIVLVENSGFDPLVIKDSISKIPEEVELEIITYNGGTYELGRGKGFGEKEIIKFAVTNSNLLANASGFVKVNGRYFVSELGGLIDKLPSSIEVFSDLRPCFKFSDSRVILCSKNFYLKFFMAFLEQVDERKGVYFEHALANAILKGIRGGCAFRLTPPLTIEGVSGSLGHTYQRGLRRRVSDYWKFICRRAMYWIFLRRYILLRIDRIFSRFDDNISR